MGLEELQGDFQGGRDPLEARSAMDVGLTYQTYWNLSAAPFDNLPDPAFYFPSAKHEEARRRLLYGIQTKKGAVMLIGDVGCGKTLLSRTLIQTLSGTRHDVALIVNPALTAMEFLVEILYQFGLDPHGSKVELLHRLNDRLLANAQQNIQAVLMVDEAHAIQDRRIFEDLRLLLNFQLNNQFLVTLVLLGQPELWGRVKSIPQLGQRIAVRYHLEPFSAAETYRYIQFRLKAAAGDPDLFTKAAVLEIFQRSGGISRIINSICDLCLVLGAQDQLTCIDVPLVTRASRIMDGEASGGMEDLFNNLGWVPPQPH